MINKITNFLQRTIDSGTVGLAACFTAWKLFATELQVANHGEMASLALFVALTVLTGLNLLKVVIKAFERGEDV